MRFKLFLLVLFFRLISFGQRDFNSFENFTYKYLRSNNITALPFDTLSGNWTIIENETATTFIIFSPFVESITYDKEFKKLKITANSPVLTSKKNYQLSKISTVTIPCQLDPSQEELIIILQDIKKLGSIHAFNPVASRFSSKNDIISCAIYNICDSLRLSEGNVQFILDNKALFNDSCDYMIAVKKGLENYLKPIPVYLGKPTDFKRLFQNQNKSMQQTSFEAFILKAMINWESDLSPKQQHRFRKKLTKKRGVLPKKCTCSACTAFTNRN